MQHTANYGLKKPLGTDVVNIADLNDNADIIDQKLKENKDAVDTKETPAGAQAKADSAEAEAKAYADSITPTKVSQLTNDKGYIAASGAPVQSVNGKTGAVSLTAGNVGAAPAAHVNDTTKHITSAERSAWNAKPSSQRGVSDSVSSTSSSVAASSKAVKTAYDKGVAAYNLANTKEPAFSKNTAFNKNFGTTSGTVCQGNDSRLSNSRKCNNTFDNVSTARSNLGLTGTSNTTHYHDSRYVQTRVYNGKLQFYYGGWKDVGGSPKVAYYSNTLQHTLRNTEIICRYNFEKINQMIMPYSGVIKIKCNLKTTASDHHAVLMIKIYKGNGMNEDRYNIISSPIGTTFDDTDSGNCISLSCYNSSYSTLIKTITVSSGDTLVFLLRSSYSSYKAYCNSIQIYYDLTDKPIIL